MKQAIIDKQKTHEGQEGTGDYKHDPPIGVINITNQTTLRCFPTMREVLSGQGKGVLNKTLQVVLLELNESERPMRYRDLSKQLQRSGFLS